MKGSYARDYGGGGPEDRAPLIDTSAVLPRSRAARDVSWLVMYVIYLLGSVAGGIYSFVHRQGGQRGAACRAGWWRGDRHRQQRRLLVNHPSRPCADSDDVGA